MFLFDFIAICVFRLSVAKDAKESGLIVSLVCDAGKTQIPAGSKTVLAVGPGECPFLSFHNKTILFHKALLITCLF